MLYSKFIIIIPTKYYFLYRVIKIIVGSKLGRFFTVDMNETKPNRPNTMNLVEKLAQELGFSEELFSSRTRSYGSGKAECVEKG